MPLSRQKARLVRLSEYIQVSRSVQDVQDLGSRNLETYRKPGGHVLEFLEFRPKEKDLSPVIDLQQRSKPPKP